MTECAKVSLQRMDAFDVTKYLTTTCPANFVPNKLCGFCGH